MSSLKQGTLFQQNVYLKNYIYSFGSWKVCNIVNARVTIALCLDIYFVSGKLLYYCFWFQIKIVVEQSLLVMSTTVSFFFLITCWYIIVSPNEYVKQLKLYQFVFCLKLSFLFVFYCICVGFAAWTCTDNARFLVK